MFCGSGLKKEFRGRTPSLGFQKPRVLGSNLRFGTGRYEAPNFGLTGEE